MKILRWIAVPFMFPIGMILGNCLGLLNGLFAHSIIGTIMLKFICGALSAVGAIYLPTYVAPAKREVVANVAFYCQVVFIILSISLAIYNSSHSGGDLLNYVASMIGCVAGTVYFKINISDFVEDVQKLDKK